MESDSIVLSKPQSKIIWVMLAISCINFIILQISSQTFWQLLSLKPVYALVNLGIISAFTGILYVCTNRLWISEMLLSGVCTIYAAINIYVVEFHGTPLTIPEFANTRTALNVLGGYSFIMIKPFILLAAVCVLSIINFPLIKMLKNNAGSPNSSWHSKTLVFLCASVYIIGILHMDFLTAPLREAWHFKEAVGKYGYPLYFLASGFKYEITVPAGFSEEKLASIPVNDYFESQTGSMQTPDIILILNETFYDISLVTSIETDANYMGTFYDMDNTISGHVVVPKVGGGTNSSEYELLTANSTYLMQGITPFQILDMQDSASVVSNLKELGYHTIAMHPAFPENYVRNKQYPKMGFDEIHFLDDFTVRDYYGKRSHVIDACAYNNMIQWYENALQQEKPVFSYLLTIQNHGEWDTNPSEDDIVHVIDYENKVSAEKLNEFLSCISLSTDALNNLIGYFMNSNRPVVLCMVGDHAPSFIEDITDKNIDNKAVMQRATPFVIWANFPIAEKQDVMISMNELGPLLLQTSGVKMLPYYNYLLELGQKVPVLTGYGNYIDKDGNIGAYTDEGRYSTDIQKYFWLEYNNLQRTSLDKWFSIE
ncbi:MAG: LTA synthase family protein [Lachnospiraceae bacterium]|nr:LTA synthase family protein [Lachnospiraceae bacterium]